MTPLSNCMDLWAIIPELILAGLGLILVPIAGLTRNRWRQTTTILAIVGIVAALAFTARMLPWQSTAVFCNTYAVDGFGAVFKLIIEAGGLISLLLIAAYFHRSPQVGHAAVAVVFATLGGVGLAAALDLVLIVLFLQMLSLASYVLVGLVRTDARGNEALIKYFIYAAVALAVMAYGFTFFFGMSGSLDLRAIGVALQTADPLWVTVMAWVIFIGYAFEMTVVPFHFWAPDVYEGATAPVAGFLSVVPKVAGFAGFLRFVLLALPGGLARWPLIIALLAVATMSLGNFLALRQHRLKRLLAYSSIAQAGYILIAVVVAGQVDGALSAVGFYLAAYLFMNLGAFAVVAQIERAVGSDEISATRGLARRAPLLAMAMAIALLSLAGIPPLAGFAGKVFLLRAALDGGWVWLAVIAAVNMVVSLYYYVAIVAEMYMKEPASEEAIPGNPGYTVVLGVTMLGSILFGILPAPLLRLTDMLSQIVR